MQAFWLINRERITECVCLNTFFGAVLIICHCERDAGNIIRIISARKATKNERKHYEGGSQ
ncbi:MAG: BrnT family toxin [Agitococcus sp.]|nr:BrnT family toxin [Agitococcus sp.]